MRPTKELPISAVTSLQNALKKSKTKSQYRRVLCIWLRATLKLSAKQIALAVGLSVSSVWRIHGLYLQNVEETLLMAEGRGGRHNENMTKSDEQAFLQSFFDEAKKGSILEVSRVKAAYELKVGYKVPKSTVYRMLERHGWKKIAPRSRHPKADPEELEKFKKISQR